MDYQKTQNFNFGPFWGLPDSAELFFKKNQASSLFLFYDSLTSFRKLEKSDEPYLRSCIVRKL